MAVLGSIFAETGGLTYFGAFVAVVYYAFALWCAWQCWKKGRWVLLLLGLFFCGLFWLIGAFSTNKRDSLNDGGRYHDGLPG